MENIKSPKSCIEVAKRRDGSGEKAKPMQLEYLPDFSLKMQGAREMLDAVIRSVKESGGKFNLAGKSERDKIFHEAIIRLVMSSLDNTCNFIQGSQIGFRNHKIDDKGKLIGVEAYFLKE